MHLSEQHQIKQGHELYRFFDNLCWESKNVYNSILYMVRQEFIRTSKLKEEGKMEHAIWIRWPEAYHLIKLQDVYRKIPSKSAQQVGILVEQNFKSYFESIKDWKKNPNKYKGRPKMPKYLDINKGRQVFYMNNQQFIIKDGELQFLKSITKNMKFKSIKSNISPNAKPVQVRIVPHNESYTLEIIYQIPDSNLKNNEGLNRKTGEIFELNEHNFLSIDLGINNFCTVSNNIDHDYFIFNGRHIKSLNQWVNKFQGKKLSQRTKNIQWNKRSNKLKHWFHHMTNILIEKALTKGSKTIVVGKNDGWKQEVNLGKKTNQNFVCIPYETFLRILKYKCEIANITLVRVGEAYTSKCSFLDMEPLMKQEEYKGKRIKRGMFRSNDGIMINADLNAALNIGRNVFPNGYDLQLNLPEGIKGFVVSPYKMTVVGQHECRRKSIF